MTRATRELRARLEEWTRIRRLAEELFEHTGENAHVIRRDDVVKHVASRMGVPVSWHMRRQVTVVMAMHGWMPMKNGNRALLVGVKRRAATAEQALATDES